MRPREHSSHANVSRRFCRLAGRIPLVRSDAVSVSGFQRVTLKPRQKRTVQMVLKADALSWWDQKQSRFEVKQEPVRVVVGGSSADSRLQRTINVVR